MLVKDNETDRTDKVRGEFRQSDKELPTNDKSRGCVVDRLVGISGHGIGVQHGQKEGEPVAKTCYVKDTAIPGGYLD
jgi:hypothetical protein